MCALGCECLLLIYSCICSHYPQLWDFCLLPWNVWDLKRSLNSELLFWCPTYHMFQWGINCLRIFLGLVLNDLPKETQENTVSYFPRLLSPNWRTGSHFTTHSIIVSLNSLVFLKDLVNLLGAELCEYEMLFYSWTSETFRTLNIYFFFKRDREYSRSQSWTFTISGL